MCGLFGFSDLQHSLTEKQASALANSLARASAVRGQDATGIAYVQSGKLRIYKRPKPAARMQLRLPKGTTQLLGHVRMTTQEVSVPRTETAWDSSDGRTGGVSL